MGGVSGVGRHSPADEQPGRRVWAAVPFKGPTGSKRRLAGLLDDAERRRLSLAMFQNVMGAVLRVDAIETVLLLTPSRELGAWSDEPRLLMIEDDRPPGNGTGTTEGLNRALQGAQRLATEGGADRLLIVPADLPLLTSSDLSAVIEAGIGASVVIAPDRDRLGTNALLLAPPAAIEPGFGDGSYLHHRRVAESAELSVRLVERPGLMLDLDTPADVGLLLAIGGDGSAVSLLRELGVDERLERGESGQARSTTI